MEDLPRSCLTLRTTSTKKDEDKSRITALYERGKTRGRLKIDRDRRAITVDFIAVVLVWKDFEFRFKVAAAAAAAGVGCSNISEGYQE
ncbi:hypothetical protein KPH14_007109 [Odynerus spinipes]|uniref:Uncharacterized protein n=1 Tax=Odynerus spinipes TaxID=1348599 RepID=A0AAD9VS10_9HYME|nr:hypothetical protein KPH14_007109 [Odynerus spinipes]